MAKTKKEHYVPRCYLKNFSNQGEERINLFDKQKMQARLNQNIMDVAMENYFYDLSLEELYKKAKPEEQEKVKEELCKILNTQNLECSLREADNQQHIEKGFFSKIEGIYSSILLNIINKAYNGNQWVIDNCDAFSKEGKEIFSFFIAIQIIRTKSFREILGATIEKTVQTMAYKSQMDDEDALPKESFEVEADKEFIKLQHSSMILDPKVAAEIAEVLSNHIWVMYVNKTSLPFYTSDDPVVNIPHKFDKFISYGGLKSEGIEIVFPISSNLLLGMYDSKTYNNIHTDREYKVLYYDEEVGYFNKVQVIHSQRYIFSSNENFELAEKICLRYPECQKYVPPIEVF